MANHFFDWFSRENPCRNFQTNEQLFLALARQESAAIVCLQEKAMPSVRKLAKNFDLPTHKTEEVLNKSTLIFLQKIADGSYQFRGHAPLTYLIEIAKNVAWMATRERKRKPESLENHLDSPDLDLEKSNENAEAVELVRHLLKELGEPCATVIRLQHIEGLSDEEVVAQRLVKYSTPDSLKMKRRDCMKKLIELAKRWKILNNI